MAHIKWQVLSRFGGNVHSVETLRYRCTNCGNVTRFDVTTNTTSRAFYHYTVGGELEVEGKEIVKEEVLDVSCRWCESPKWVVEVISKQQ